MLIDSDELMKRLARLKYDLNESKAYFSQYRAAADCIQKMEDIIADIEADTAGKNAQHKYASALEGLREK